MFFSVNVGTIKAALDRIIPTIEKKSTIPALSGILIVATEDGKITLSGTDLVTEIHGTINGDVQEPGSVCIIADKFNQMVKLLNTSSDISMKTVGDSRSVSIKSNRTNFKLASEDPESFPDLKGDVTDGASIQLGTTDFEDALGSVMYAASSDETRNAICSVCIDIQDGKAHIVATDGHRLAKHSIDVHGNWQESRTSLPRKSAQMFGRAIVSCEDEFITLMVNDGRASVSVGDFVYTTKLIMEGFPDYDTVIPSHDKKVILGRKAFESCIRKTIVVANEFTHDALFQFGGDSDGLVVSAIETRSSADSSQDFVSCQLNSVALDVGCNASFIQDALKTISTDNIEIYVKDSISPFLIKGEDKPEVVHVCMPMRI